MLLARESIFQREIESPFTPDRPKPRRVLVVAPHFPPVNAPDGQRARLIVPHLHQYEWVAEVLTVRPEFVEAPLDRDLAATLPAELRVHQVIALSPRATRRMGWGSLAWRAYSSLRRHGDELLADGRFDLVFFTTCQFAVLPLGPYWRRRHGVPYVLDFHDEWAGDYYSRHRSVRPPGGRFKHAVSHILARWQEGEVVRRAARIVSVSPRYNVNLRARHHGLDPARLSVLPFGAAERDFEILKRRHFAHHFFEPGAGPNWVYVGRGGPTMRLTARAFFLALQRAVTEKLAPPGLRLHFIGTDYAMGDRARLTFVPLAREAELEVPVHEKTARVPHFTALQCLRDADAVLVFGSDDPGYSASKLIPCLHARKPLLGIFHEASTCVQDLKDTRGGVAATFVTGESSEVIADRIFEAWFATQSFNRRPRITSAMLAPFGAAAMTRQLAAIFSAACAKPEGRA